MKRAWPETEHVALSDSDGRLEGDKVRGLATVGCQSEGMKQ